MNVSPIEAEEALDAIQLMMQKTRRGNFQQRCL